MTKRKPQTPERAIGKAYIRVWNLVVEVHALWDIHCKWFSDAASVDVLNKTSGVIGFMLQRSLTDAMIVQCCRLTDEAATGKFKNITLKALFNSLPDTFKPNEKRSLLGMLKRIDRAVGPMRRHRNKRVAHIDQSSASRLPKVTKKHFERALAEIDKFMNVLSRHYGSESTFELPDTKPGADIFISRLRLGAETERVCVRVLHGRSMSATDAIRHLDAL